MRKYPEIKKATGWKPGAPENLTWKSGAPENLTEEARLKGLKIRRQNARDSKANRQAKELIQGYRAQGFTFQMIGDKLNDLGMRTRIGREFKAMTVKQHI